MHNESIVMTNSKDPTALGIYQKHKARHDGLLRATSAYIAY